MHHVTRPAGDDLLRLPIRVAVGVDELPPIQTKGSEVPSHRATTDHDAFGLELERDPRCRPLSGSAHLLDPLNHRWARSSRLMTGRGRRSVNNLLARNS